MIIQMVARDVGEGARGKRNAVSAALLQAVARSLEGEMGDAVLGETGEDRMQLDRVWRGVLERQGAARADHADRTEACRAEPLPRPQLAYEGGDRGLAVGAGDGDGDLGLEAEEARGDQSEAPARVLVLDDGKRGRRARRTLGHEDRSCAPLQRILDEARAIGLHTRQRGEQVAGLHRAAIGGEPGDRNARPGRRQLRLRPDQLTQSHSRSRPQKRPFP